jgi:AraC-like DNA-binding protein
MHAHGDQHGRNGDVEVRRLESLGGLELIRASYGRWSFPRHMHDEYVLGIMTRGAEQLSCRNRTWTAARNSLILLNPGEPHANCSLDDQGFTYRVCYVPVETVAGLLDEPPLFPVPVVEKSPAAAALLRLLRHAREGNPEIENETYLAEALAQLAASHGEHRPLAAVGAASADGKIDVARDYLEASFAENVPLKQLASLAGLAPCHFLRAFRRRVGLPPAEYQMHLRLIRAKALLRRGMPIASVAAEVGFADQSHLTRRFKAVVGLTPGAYVRGGTGDRAAAASSAARQQ